MNSTDSSDLFTNKKKSGDTQYNYGSSKKIRLHEHEGGADEEGDSGRETKPVKTVKKSSSSKGDFGKKYLLNLGYVEGSGLGKYGNGIVEPIEASKQRGRRGFGFEAVDIKNAVSKFDPSLEEISVDEDVQWLTNDYPDTVDRICLESWMKTGASKKCVDENSQFCDPDVISNILSSKNVLNTITPKDLKNGRRRANPFESIQKGIFLNRAAMKMANMDAILDWMFTEPKNINGEKQVKPNELLYFADVCAGPGGFSEYVLYRKKWRAKGFGFTLRQENDFLLEQFWAGPPESFEPYYGVNEDGNVYSPENILSLKNHVLKQTEDRGVHFMMADGGVHIDVNFNDQELICKKLYLCQCLIALLIVRAEGHFVVKLFDLFTEFSVGLIYLMYRSFREISIIKPNTSRPANSERYLVCKWKRDDCHNIAEHLFEVNKKVPEYNEKQTVYKDDVIELVPSHVLLEDRKFFNYILDSNNKLGKKQFVSLLKLIVYSENVDMQEERQQDLRKTCLKKWKIPDEARAEPKKCDARTKWIELTGNSSLCSAEWDIKKSTISSFESFKSNIVSIHSWYCLVLSGEESNNTCAFYVGLGRNHVHRCSGGKWTKLSDSRLCLPANTLVYGEIINEYLGAGKRQRKISALHIIDGLFLGGEDIRHLCFMDRLSACSLFAKSLYKETFPIRVKAHYSLADIELLRERLVLKPTKSSSLQSLCIPLEADTFYKAGAIVFLRDTRDNWHRYLSKSTNYFFFHKIMEKKCENIYENHVKKRSMSKEIYGDFEQSFCTKMVWWWDERVVHDSHSSDVDPNKLQWENIIDYVRRKK